MPKRRARTRSRAKQRKSLLSRPGVWLGTLGTVVAIATGMFQLRDNLWPREAGKAVASADYQRSVGRICDAVNQAEESRAADTSGLRGKLRRARTNLQQRDAILDVEQRIVSLSGDNLTQLRSLGDVPKRMAGTYHRGIAAWTRNNGRVAEYVQRLEGVGDRSQLLDAIDASNRIKSDVTKDSGTVTTALRELGGPECRLDPPKVTSTITLPSLPTTDRREVASAPTRRAAAPHAPSRPSVHATPHSKAAAPAHPATPKPAPGKPRGTEPSHTPLNPASPVRPARSKTSPHPPGGSRPRGR